MEQVDSPNEARAYGTGEVIIIDVVFNQEVTLEGQPTLLLETGVFNQEVTCACCQLHGNVFAATNDVNLPVFSPTESTKKATTLLSIPSTTQIFASSQLSIPTAFPTVFPEVSAS